MGKKSQAIFNEHISIQFIDLIDFIAKKSK